MRKLINISAISTKPLVAVRAVKPYPLFVTASKVNNINIQQLRLYAEKPSSSDPFKPKDPKEDINYEYHTQVKSQDRLLGIFLLSIVLGYFAYYYYTTPKIKAESATASKDKEVYEELQKTPDTMKDMPIGKRGEKGAPYQTPSDVGKSHSITKS